MEGWVTTWRVRFRVSLDMKTLLGEIFGFHIRYLFEIG